MAWILLWSSALRVHDSQAYRKMDVTRERISHILELREILLSFQTGFNLLNAAVICANLKSISGLEPSSVITEPRYLKLWLSQASVQTHTHTHNPIVWFFCMTSLIHSSDRFTVDGTLTSALWHLTAGLRSELAAVDNIISVHSKLLTTWPAAKLFLGRAHLH